MMAKGQPIIVSCSSKQAIPASGLPIVKNISHGRQTARNERLDINNTSYYEPYIIREDQKKLCPYLTREPMCQI